MGRARAEPIESEGTRVCRGAVSDQTMRERRRTGPDHRRCGVGATVRLDGVDYCRRHAGQAALRILMREDERC